MSDLCGARAEDVWDGLSLRGVSTTTTEDVEVDEAEVGKWGWVVDLAALSATLIAAYREKGVRLGKSGKQ